jgi:hypothetical protein
MSGEERVVQALVAKIRVLEKRLSVTQGISNDNRTNLVDLFPSKGVCLYNCLLGDAYLALKNFRPNSRIKGGSIDDACLQAYAASMQCSSSCLDMVDRKWRSHAVTNKQCILLHSMYPCTALRLLCIYSWCNAQILICRDYKKARQVADSTFNQASLHTNTIGPESIQLLQRLRDDIILYQPKAADAEISGGSTRKTEAKAMQETLTTKPARQTTAKDTSEQAATEIAAGGGSTEDVSIHRREVAQCTLAVRRVVSLPVPVQLDVVSSASLILKALDKIFRTYVRGTALPGHLSGGNTVDFDGTTLTFRNFILHGPYISWKGFVHFLFDFTVAAPPALNSRLGRSFLSEVLGGNKSRLPGGGETAANGDAVGRVAEAGEAVAAPVTMLEAAVCFVGMHSAMLHIWL